MKKILGTAASILFGTVIGVKATEKKENNKKIELQKMSDKHLELYLMMNQWVRIKQEGKNLALWFEKQGYKKIAIYGMSYAGETLFKELSNTSVEVKYGVDKNGDWICAEIEVWQPEDELDEVDAIAVTTISYFEDVKELLSKKVNCPIINLKNILDEVEKWN